MSTSLILIALGGAAGAIGRFLVSRVVYQLLATEFPVATLLVNVTGSFILGFLAKSLSENQAMGSLLAIGFLGAFTTFSSFGLESMTLLRAGKTQLFLLNVFLNLTLSFAAVAIGLWLKKN